MWYCWIMYDIIKMNHHLGNLESFPSKKYRTINYYDKFNGFTKIFINRILSFDSVFIKFEITWQRLYKYLSWQIDRQTRRQIQRLRIYIIMNATKKLILSFFNYILFYWQKFQSTNVMKNTQRKPILKPLKFFNVTSFLKWVEDGLRV